MNKEKCIHVQFKNNGTNFYFGSIAAIYELFSVENIGISQQGLYDYALQPGRHYENSKVVINKGDFRRKKGNRRNPLKHKKFH